MVGKYERVYGGHACARRRQGTEDGGPASGGAGGIRDVRIAHGSGGLPDGVRRGDGWLCEHVYIWNDLCTDTSGGREKDG
jgi:hypothetical protein